MCTIEKANLLVNRMLEEDSLGQLGALVVDELHMVGDDDRWVRGWVGVVDTCCVCLYQGVSSQAPAWWGRVILAGLFNVPENHS